MKFFDLEMGECLAFAKKGGRDVSWYEGTISGCQNWKFTGGNSYETCMGNQYKELLSAICGTNTAPIQVTK